MKKFLAKIYNYYENYLEHNKDNLRLKSIVKKDNKIFCEFNEILRLDGNLVKYSIEEVGTNANLQESIPPKTLFIIGTIYGKHINSIKEFRVKIIDIKNNSVTLENSVEKIVISIGDLLYDEALIKQINPNDLIKIICPYIYKLGYEARRSLDDEVTITAHDNPSSNVVSLFNTLT